MIKLQRAFITIIFIFMVQMQGTVFNGPHPVLCTHEYYYCMRMKMRICFLYGGQTTNCNFSLYCPQFSWRQAVKAVCFDFVISSNYPSTSKMSLHVHANSKAYHTACQSMKLRQRCWPANAAVC